MKINSLHIYSESMPHVFGKNHAEIELQYEDIVKGERFWGKNIESVVAIVGNNGSGKSSILNGIKNGSIEIRTEPNNAINDANKIIVYFSPFIDDSNEYSNQNNQIDLSKYYTIQRDTPYETQSFATVFEIHKSQQTWRILRLLLVNAEKQIITEDLNLPLFDKIKIKANFIENILHNTSYQFRSFFNEIDKIIDRSREQFRGESEFDDGAYQENELKNHLLKVITDKIKHLFEITGNRYLMKGIIKNENFTESNNLRDSLEFFVRNAGIEMGNTTIRLPVDEILNLVDLLIGNIPEGSEIENTTEMYVTLQA